MRQPCDLCLTERSFYWNFTIFAFGSGSPFQNIDKKKRYAYLVSENVGNFRPSKDSIVGSRFCI